MPLLITPPVVADALDLDVDHELQLPTDAFFGQRIAVLGASGFGKGNTIAVLFEELGGKLPIHIIDPHGEYYGLKERFDILIVGKGEFVDIEMGVDQAEAIARFAYHNQIHVIINMLEMTDDERLEFTYLYCNTLWELNKRAKQPIGVILDEAHIFIPETKANVPSLKMLSTFALEGRKFGFTVMISDQRVASVSKTILAQCGMAFLHGVDIYADMQAYQGMLPYSMAETKSLAYNLKRGEAIVKWTFEGDRGVNVVKVRKRHTFHASDTPKSTGDTASKFQPRQLNASLIDGLKTSMAPKANPESLKSVERPSLDTLDGLMNFNKRLAEAQDKYERQHRLEHLRLYLLSMAYARAIKQFKQQVQMLEAAASRVKMEPVVPLAQPPLIEGHEPTEDYRTPLSLTRAVNKQINQFEALLTDLKKLPPYQQLMLVYLAKYEGQEMELRQISRFIGIAHSTMHHKPPMELFRRKLLSRRLTGRGGQYYKATIREMLKINYPDLNQDDLFMKVIAIQRLT